MQTLTKSKSSTELSDTQTASMLILYAPIAIAVISAIGALVGIFLISSWAEASEFHHGIQHVIIFLSGTGFGSALVAGYASRRRSEKQ